MKKMPLHYKILALCFTATAMVMGAAGAFDRGGTPLDEVLLVTAAIAMTGAVHFLLAYSRHPVCWALWVGCLVCVLYGQVCFIVNASERAGQVHAKQTPQVVGAVREIEAIREDLDKITAKPVSVVASELAATAGWQKRSALKTELEEARRAARLHDKLVTLTTAEAAFEVMGATDPVTEKLASLLGVTRDSIALFVSLVISVLLELVGVFLWSGLYEYRGHIPKGDDTPSRYEDLISKVRDEIRAGGLKPTVAEIRKFLGCGQSTAMKIHRHIHAQKEDGKPAWRRLRNKLAKFIFTLDRTPSNEI
jgi:hypothetical protein